MKARTVVKDVQWMGVVDWDRRLFDELIPLPDGTSYNSYLVRGSDKTVLIDAVDPPFAKELLSNLEAEGVSRIDYVVSHHTEQDHSGAIPDVLKRYPEAKVLCSDKAQGMLADHLAIPLDKLQVVKDSERLPLGGLTLEFIYYPWVHWPETMLTYLPERKTLFTCDFFGSHLATADLFADDEALVLTSAKRYYAEIMMPFRAVIEKNMAKVTSRDVEIIAPSHGPVYRRPQLILDAYRDWVSGPPRNLLVVPYVSMHGSTKIMVEHFVGSCVEKGVRAEQFHLVSADIGKLAMLLVDAASVVVGTPTVLGAAHPLASNAVHLANLLRPKVKYLSIIGSFGWGAKAVEHLASLAGNLKVEILSPVLCKGLPRKPDLEALDHLAAAFAEKHKGLV